MKYLLLILLAIPFLDLALLVVLTAKYGLWMMAWVSVSALIGIGMLRNQKLGALMSLAGLLRDGQTSVWQLLWPVRFILAGVLFVWPGVLTDLLAVLLLLPFKGPALAVRQPFAPGAAGSGPADDGAIDGEYTRVEDDKTLR